jgi:hypothetical protein
MERTRIRYRESEEVRPEPEYRYLSGWPFLTVGFGTEKDYFVENLSLLVQSGMGITASLESKKADAATKKKLADFYLKHAKCVNNWDLVDSSAPMVLGSSLAQKNGKILDIDEELSRARLSLCEAVKSVLTDALKLLTIETVEEM